MLTLSHDAKQVLLAIYDLCFKKTELLISPPDAERREPPDEIYNPQALQELSACPRLLVGPEYLFASDRAVPHYAVHAALHWTGVNVRRGLSILLAHALLRQLEYKGDWIGAFGLPNGCVLYITQHIHQNPSSTTSTCSINVYVRDTDRRWHQACYTEGVYWPCGTLFELTPAGLEVAEALATATGQPAPLQQVKRKRRGRKRDTDVRLDQRIFEAWESGYYKSYAQLGQAFELTPRQVRLAIDRHRKRLPKGQ